jgi:hypothetical protein
LKKAPKAPGARTVGTYRYVEEGSALRVVWDDTPEPDLPIPEGRGPVVRPTYDGRERSHVVDSNHSEDFESLLEALRASLRRKAPTLKNDVQARVSVLSGVLPAVVPFAQRLAARLDCGGIEPDRLQVSVDGSVMMYFYGSRLLEGGAHERYALFEAGDEGIAVLLKDRLEGKPSIWSVETDDEIGGAVEKALDFVGA